MGTVPDEKPCRKCGKSLPTSAFAASRSGFGDGLKGTCRGCEGGPRVSLEVRLWRNVDRRGPDECWPWLGRVDKDGYGKIRIGRRRPRSAHVVAWETVNGPMPDGLFGCHTCDNPPCCNPAHVFKGTVVDNNHDRHTKGRDALGEKNGMRRHPEARLYGDDHWTHKKPDRLAHQKGEAHGLAKLTDDAVREIRRLSAESSMSQREIGELFGVSSSTIGFVLQRKRWAHVA